MSAGKPKLVMGLTSSVDVLGVIGFLVERAGVAVRSRTLIRNPRVLHLRHTGEETIADGRSATVSI